MISRQEILGTDKAKSILHHLQDTSARFGIGIPHDGRLIFALILLRRGISA